MSHIITYYSGRVDLNAAFGDQKEYSEPFAYFCCPRDQTVIRNKQCPNAGKSSKEIMGGRKGA